MKELVYKKYLYQLYIAFILEYFKSYEWLTFISGVKNKNSWYLHCISIKFDISIAKFTAYSQGEEYLSNFYTNCKSLLF
jgi:hypothetical protein